jgi:hypothetical protein
MQDRPSKTFLNAVLCVAFACVVTALGPAAARAASAPTQLYNKTITINWGESGVYRRISDGVNTNPVGQFQLTVYVSSAGRAFVRGSSKAGRFGNTRERGPDETSGNVQFSGNTLTMVRENIGIARRVLTTFDGSFAGCTTTVTIGKINSNATMTGFDGAEYHIVSMQPGAASCSIKEGNALAN